jgi:hypothetical protein
MAAKKKKDAEKTKTEETEKMVEVELSEALVKYDFSQDELVAIGEEQWACRHRIKSLPSKLLIFRTKIYADSFSERFLKPDNYDIHKRWFSVESKNEDL